MKKCIVCKQPQFVAQTEFDVVCGECNENLEGTFTGDHPTFYAPIDDEYIVGVQVETFACDKQVVGLTLEQLLAETTVYAEVTCPCPRDETRWNVGEHHHL